MNHSDSQHDGMMGQNAGMMGRGATRPMMPGDSDVDRGKMLEKHHTKTLWVWWTVILLGVWVLVAPLTFGYGTGVVDASGGRELWLTTTARIAAMKWSDIVTGALIAFFGWRSLTPNRPVSMWICCFLGCWLTFAPVLFWAPTAAAYMNDTIVGMLVISLTILVPGMPNMVAFMKMGGDVPRGWSYNPSSWAQRSIMIALAFVGFVVSRYLAAYQLGYIDHVWDPFFGGGSRRVLDSAMSHSLPVSDAALGALAYTFEFLMGFMGATSRWRTMPWMVTFFGILVLPLGLVHIFLVISQPVIVGSWCTLCLVAAAIMLPMLPLEADEVVAMGQHMVESKRKGHRLWSVFWKGGPAGDALDDERSPKLMALPKEPRAVVNAATWGMSVPWTLVAATLLGVALTFTPTFFGLAKAASDAPHLLGLLTVTFAVIAMGEPLRPLRFLNVLLGLAAAVAPWVFGHAPLGAKVMQVALGVAIVVLSLPRGPKKEQYGLWDRFVV